MGTVLDATATTLPHGAFPQGAALPAGFHPGQSDSSILRSHRPAAKPPHDTSLEVSPKDWAQALHKPHSYLSMVDAWGLSPPCSTVRAGSAGRLEGQLLLIPGWIISPGLSLRL